MGMKVAERPGVSTEQLTLEYHLMHARVMLHLTNKVEWQDESDSLRKAIEASGYDVDVDGIDSRAVYLAGMRYGKPLTITPVS